jgi:uncharacterized protein (DUF1015 family)
VRFIINASEQLNTMPTIQAFRGLRYDLGHVGSLSDVIAPPYDVISPEFQDALYKQHPCNYIRIELNRDEPGDGEHNNRYTRAANFLKQWRQEGVLQLEPDPCFYVYNQTFEYEGRMITRRGFMGRVRLERFGEGKIYPHEETHASAKQDRLLLTRACKANPSQIFGLYPDPQNEAQNLLEAAVADKTPIVATDHLGVVHHLWPVNDMHVINKVSAILDAKPLFIADGHHRYETACNYRDELAAQGTLDAQHPANFTLMQCVSMSDPGMIVLPTHRLFRGIAPLTSAELVAKLSPCFQTTAAGKGPAQATSIWNGIEKSKSQDRIAFYTAQDDAWTVVELSEQGKQRMAELSTDHSEDWQELGVAILHRLIMDNLLQATNLPKPMYVHSIPEVIEGLTHGDTVGRDATGQLGSGGKFNLAALVMPATVDHVRVISEHGERMPAKSTYFYPKLLSGVVIYPHT